MVAQPTVTQDVLASLLAKNASEVAAQQEWEAEWNQAGLASRLSESVSEERETGGGREGGKRERGRGRREEEGRKEGEGRRKGREWKGKEGGIGEKGEGKI